MATVEAIRKITIQATAQGVPQATSQLDNLTASQQRVAASADQLSKSINAAQQMINENVQQLNALKSANDNVQGSFTGLLGKVRDVTGGFDDTVEHTLNLINHLKLLALGAYAMSPALRSIVNADVAKALGYIPPVAAKAASSMLSFAAPALSFFSRIAVPITAAVLAWKGLNYTIDLGAGLLEKYGNAERSLFGSDVQANLDKLTKLQPDYESATSITPGQAQEASELSNRLADAKRNISEFLDIQLNLNEPALKLQSIWVGIVGAIGDAAAKLNAMNGPEMPGFLQKYLDFVGAYGIFPGGRSPSPGKGNLDTSNQYVQPGYEMDLATRKLTGGLGQYNLDRLSGVDADQRAQFETQIARSGFTGRFSQDIYALTNDVPKPKDEKGRDDYDRTIQSIKDQVAALAIEAQGAGKTSQAVEELKVAHEANLAAMKANIPVTDAMRAQWKAMGDQIAAYNIQIKQAAALQEETFKSATMFMSPSDSAAASVAHGIDPTNWQAHMNDPAAQTAAMLEDMKQTQSLAISFGDTFSSAMLNGATAAKAFNSALGGLESSLLKIAENRLINNLLDSLFSAFKPGGGSTSDPTHLGSLYARGGVFNGGLEVHPFALGGLLSDILVKPTLFPMANGMGLAGEAGPEAIMPLRRDSSGRLGVAAAGAAGGGTQVNVMVQNNHPSAGVDVQQQQRPDGGVDIVAVITSTMDQHVSNGGLDGVMRARYGAPVRPRAR
jgi:hypothetical protein